jgi:shikimate kinase
MQRLAAAGPVVYLQTNFETLEKRVAATPHRGIASSAGHSFTEIHAERCPLYQRYADITIDTANFTAEDVARAVLAELMRG